MSIRKTATHHYFGLAAVCSLSALLWIPAAAHAIGFEVHKGSLALDSFQFPSEAVGGQDFLSGKVFIRTSPGGRLIGHLNQVTGAGVFMISCDIRLPSLTSLGLRSFKTASTPTFFISRQDQLLILFDVSNVSVPLPQADDGTPPSEIKATAFYVLAYSISRSDVDELLNGTSDAIVAGETVDLGRERYDRLVRSRFLPMIMSSYAEFRRVDPTAPHIPFSVFQRAERLFDHDPNTETQIYFPDGDRFVPTNVSSVSQWRLDSTRPPR